MISLFIMYSPDRLPQLRTMLRCMEDMDLYHECQKIIVADEVCNVQPDGFDVVVVPRPTGQFNWSAMWKAGVEECKFENILYLDSDRILPKNYLTLVHENMAPGRSLFCGSLFNFKDYHDPEVILGYRDLDLQDILCDWEKYKLVFDYDPRWRLPIHGPGKGPASGNMAFTKADFWKVGGVDPWYEGHGAYADTDLHKSLHEAGVEFHDLDVPEFHLRHPKLGEDDEELTMKDIEVLSLNNYVYHCHKWSLGYNQPRMIASWLNLSRDFVDRVLEQINTGDYFTPIWT